MHDPFRSNLRETKQPKVERWLENLKQKSFWEKTNCWLNQQRNFDRHSNAKNLLSDFSF